jgi:hypothetical protein
MRICSTFGEWVAREFCWSLCLWCGAGGRYLHSERSSSSRGTHTKAAAAAVAVRPGLGPAYAAVCGGCGTAACWRIGPPLVVVWSDRPTDSPPPLSPESRYTHQATARAPRRGPKPQTDPTTPSQNFYASQAPSCTWARWSWASTPSSPSVRALFVCVVICGREGETGQQSRP